MRAAVATLVAVAAGPALGFHSGGVGPCEGCHSMHNSFEGAAVITGQTQFTTGAYLLKGSDPSSVCLHCHEAAASGGPTAFFISTSSVDLTPGQPPKQLSPGGDFGWLKKSYTWTPTLGGPVSTSPGEGHGHNIVAVEYGYTADGTHSMAPGGTYPSSNLGCSSCHDPHGRYRRVAGDTIATDGLPIASSGSYASSPAPVGGVSAVGAYRLLAGVGYRPKSLAAGFAFTSSVPDAVAPDSYNRSESATQTRVAYGKNSSEWCANCHANLLQASRTTATMNGLNHPVGNTATMSAAVQGNYIAYVKTGVITNVDPTRAYWSLVPFEEGTNSYAVLKLHARTDDAYLNGPDSLSTVSCLTCHRAHASGFDSSLRFRANAAGTVPFITVPDGGGAPAWPDPATAPAEAQGRSQLETQTSYYGRPATLYAPSQATFCNKCHVRD